MSENMSDKNRLSDDELENVSGGSLKIFEKCVQEIQNSIYAGRERESALLLKYNYASLPQMTRVILAQKFREQFGRKFTDSPYYK